MVMKEYFIDNAWLISLLAIGISFISLILVAIDKFKLWYNQGKTKSLKRDFVFLKKIVELDVENFYSVKITDEKFNYHRSVNPEYSKLYYIFQTIDEKDICEKNVRTQLSIVKLLKVDELFIKRTTPQGTNLSLQFCNEIETLIKLAKRHLAQIM
jgi:hypothetical protein